MLHVLQVVRVVVGLFGVGPALLEDVGLEPRTEVCHADEGIDDGQDNQQDSKHRKGRQALSHGRIDLGVAGLVDAHQLEEEVGQAAEVEQDGEGHADLVLVAREEGCREQDEDGYRDGGDGQRELGLGNGDDDDEELDREAQEEEKIELQQCDVDLGKPSLVVAPSGIGNGSVLGQATTYLVMEEPLLHAVISSDLLENIPGKLLIELPCDEGHQNCGQGNDARDRNQERLGRLPDVNRACSRLHLTSRLQHADGFVDLVDLDGRVHQQGQVGYADSDNLNGVLHPQSVPYQNQLVQKAEYEERQEGRNSPVLRVGIFVADRRS